MLIFNVGGVIMKYLMLDTQIYIDLMLSRKADNKPDTYKNLEKLLSYNRIRLIVPEIVKTEVFRHLENEVKRIGNILKKIKNEIHNELYWINSIKEIEIFNDKLDSVKKGINELSEEFKKKEMKYVSEIDGMIRELFNQPSVILIEENQNVLFKALKRKVYKKMPFHYNNDKDSLADAVIIETLINIKDFIKLKREDEVYFISDNPKDFSDKNNKESFHIDIQNDLIKMGIDSQVKYSNFLYKTLKTSFSKEIEKAGILESVEQEYLREQDAMVHSIMIDDARDMAGLPSLNMDYEQYIREDSEIESLLNNLNDYSADILSMCEEYSEDYEVLKNSLEDYDKSNLNVFIEKINELNLFDEPIEIESDIEDQDILDEVLSNVNAFEVSEDEVIDLNDSIIFSEMFELNDSLISFDDFENNHFTLNVEGDLDPYNGGQDLIELIFKKNNDVLAKAIIEMDYGEASFYSYSELSYDGYCESLNIRGIEDVLESIDKEISLIKAKIQIQTKLIENLLEIEEGFHVH